MKISDETLAAHLRLQGLTRAAEWINHVRAHREYHRDSGVIIDYGREVLDPWSAVTDTSILSWGKETALSIEYDMCTLSNGETYRYSDVPEDE